MRSSFLAFIALCFAAPAAFAWHDSGHKLAARIAFGLLDEASRQRVTSILRAHPRFAQDFAALMPDDVANGDERARALWLFEQASIWPDLIQKLGHAVRDEYHYGTWHYINLPVFLTRRDNRALSGELHQNVSMEFEPPLRRGLNIVQALQGNLRVWQDEHAPDDDKAVALCWILHLTGDIHQPLHNVALFSARYFPEGDRGGNSIAVRRKPENTNLHAAWDGLIRRDDAPVAGDDTKRLLSNDSVDDAAIGAWSRRGHVLAKQYVYARDVRQQILAHDPGEGPPLVSLTDGYIAAARKLARQQVIIAGHRIASLLSAASSASR